MDKRRFIKTISLATLAPFYSEALSNIINNISPEKLATNDDFCLKVRQDYKLKPDYINLESGYYNILPTSTLNKMVEHAQMVNYKGSYYMRTVQWENKNRMREKLAKVVGCSSKNIIITRNTTESLNMVIKGMNWEEGDEAVFAEQDYGAMKLMFEQESKRFGMEIK